MQRVFVLISVVRCANGSERDVPDRKIVIFIGDENKLLYHDKSIILHRKNQKRRSVCFIENSSETCFFITRVSID